MNCSAILLAVYSKCEPQRKPSNKNKMIRKPKKLVINVKTAVATLRSFFHEQYFNTDTNKLEFELSVCGKPVFFLWRDFQSTNFPSGKCFDVNDLRNLWVVWAVQHGQAIISAHWKQSFLPCAGGQALGSPAKFVGSSQTSFSLSTKKVSKGHKVMKGFAIMFSARRSFTTTR